jgi:hypothetical protein
MGETAEPLIIIRDNGGNLGLLEHELGDEDGVGIASLAPGEGAPVTAIPTKKRATEDAKVWSRNQVEENVEHQTPNVQSRIQS